MSELREEDEGKVKAEMLDFSNLRVCPYKITKIVELEQLALLIQFHWMQ